MADHNALGFIFPDTPAENANVGSLRADAEMLAEIIETSRRQFAIGIYGGWGSGKSTLMKAIKDKVDSRNPVEETKFVTAQFSAWMYQKEESVVMALSKELETTLRGIVDARIEARIKAYIDARSDAQKSIDKSKATSFFSKLYFCDNKVCKWIIKMVVKTFYAKHDDRRFVRWVVEAVTLFFGKSDEVTLKKLLPTYRGFFRLVADWFKGINFNAALFGLSLEIKFNQRACLTSFSNKLVSTNKKVVVFVDDLDRCSPDTAFATLEAIKVFFDLRGFFFVVAVDDKVVERIIDQRYEGWSPSGGSRESSGRILGAHYLEKMFPVTQRVMRDDDVVAGKTKCSADAYLQAWIKERPETLTEAEESILKGIMMHAKYLLPCSGFNPRQLKRFVNHCILVSKLGNRQYARLLIEYHKGWTLVQWAQEQYRQIFWDSLRRAVEEKRYSSLEELDPSLREMPQTFLKYVSPKSPGHILLPKPSSKEAGTRFQNLAREIERLCELVDHLNKEQQGDARSVDFSQTVASIEKQLALVREGAAEQPKEFACRLKADLVQLQEAMTTTTKFYEEGPDMAADSFHAWLTQSDSLKGDLRTTLEEEKARRKLPELPPIIIRLRALFNYLNKEKEGDARSVDFAQTAASIEQQLALVREGAAEQPKEFAYRLEANLERLQKEMTRFRQERPYATVNSFDAWLKRSDSLVGDMLRDLAEVIPLEGGVQ